MFLHVVKCNSFHVISYCGSGLKLCCRYFYSSALRFTIKREFKKAFYQSQSSLYCWVSYITNKSVELDNPAQKRQTFVNITDEYASYTMKGE